MTARREALLEKLAVGGRVDSHGDFTLDMVKARDKLRQFQLLSPHMYVLELVGAAVSGGCSAVDVVTAVDRVTFILHDLPPYSRQELSHIYSSLFLPQSAPDTDRLRQLAIGLNACLALQPRTIEVVSGGPRGTSVLRLTARSEELSSGPPLERCRTTITVAERLNWVSSQVAIRRLLPGWLDHGVALLRGRCKHAPVPIRINGRSINAPVQLEPYLAQVTHESRGIRATLALPSSIPVGIETYLEESRRYGSLVWFTGRPPGVPLDDGHVVFMCSGVMLSRKDVQLSGLLPVKALCAAPGLLKNASQSDVVENTRYYQVLDLLQSMVAELMEEVVRVRERLEEARRDTRRWPAENPHLFCRYVEAEQLLADSYLARWEEFRSRREADPAPMLPDVDLTAPAEGPAPPEELELDDDFLISLGVDDPAGRGVLALPRWSEEGRQPASSFAVLREGRKISPQPPPPVLSLAGYLECDRSLPASPGGHGEYAGTPGYHRVVRLLTTAVEHLMDSLLIRYPLLPGGLRPQARRYLLAYAMDHGRNVRGLQMASPTSCLGRIVRLPMLEAIDGTEVSIWDVLRGHNGGFRPTFHYVLGSAHGRPLDPSRRVLRLSSFELKLLASRFGPVEYSTGLQEDERARVLQQERGGPAVPDVNADDVLVSAPGKVEGLSFWVGLPRRFPTRGSIRFYKRGVAIVEEPGMTLHGHGPPLPCVGWVQSDDLTVDASWTRVTLTAHARREIGQKVAALYGSLVSALAHLDHAHQDFESACRYVCAYLLHFRGQLLGPSVPTDHAAFLALRFIPSRQGRFLDLVTLLEQRQRLGYLYYSNGQSHFATPEPLINLHRAPPWMRAFLEEFFGSELLVPWEEVVSPAAPPPTADLPVPADPLLADLVQILPEAARLRLEPRDHGVLLDHDDDGVVLNTRHPLWKRVRYGFTRDPGLVFHLAAALQGYFPSSTREFDFLMHLLDRLSKG